MRKTRILFLSVLLSLVIVSSCKKDDPVNETEVLLDYVEAMVTPATLPGYITAADLNSANLLDQAYIIDIRSAADFADGHIDGAHNVTTNVLEYLDGVDVSGYEKIAIVCYTGQTAAWTTALLRVAGYTNTFSLKFGMSGWHPDFDRWTANVGNTYFSQFESTDNAKGAAGDYPELSTGFESGEDILDARLDVVFGEGFSTAAIAASAVFANLNDYYIINYWPNAQYISPGHVPGAVNYVPGESFTTTNNLNTLPTDKTIVVYCYTGQTSAFMAAYLRLMGYDAKSLKFGANGMIYDNMPASKWTPLVEGYSYVSGK
jgi:rhodanese-related sulfurtransferase